MSNFGKKLLKARTEKGLSRREVAEASGVNQATLFNWEMRDMHPRTFLALASAADAVDLRPQDIIK